MTATLGFVGGGRMGEALIAGALRSGRSADSIVVVEASAARCQEIHERYRVVTAPEATTLRGVSTVVLAVKPQQIAEVCREIADHLTPGTLVVSVAAGTTIAALSAALPGHRIVRVMPNTPALIGRGMSAVCAGSQVSDDDLTDLMALLGAVGDVVRVEEAQMDAVTAVSGSGPAYAFYLAEAMESAAESLGLSAEVARRLVAQTLAGAGELLATSQRNPADLRADVTSPGGTTQAAIESLDRDEVAAAIQRAVVAAAKRSEELSN